MFLTLSTLSRHTIKYCQNRSFASKGDVGGVQARGGSGIEYPPETPSTRAKFRDRPGESTKFEEFNWNSAGTSPLRSVAIGPAGEYVNAVRLINESLLLAGATEVKIVLSSIPYRATCKTSL